MVHPGQRAQLAAALGRTTTDPAYLQARLDREQLRQEVLKTMADLNLDALVYTTSDHYQPLIPDDVMSLREGGPRAGSNSALSPAIGFPALTVPAGLTPDGFPVGLSFLGRPFAEGLLFALAHGFEQARQHREPPRSAPALPGEP
jgi:amidase